jgi:hypothetical protein
MASKQGLAGLHCVRHRAVDIHVPLLSQDQHTEELLPVLLNGERVTVTGSGGSAISGAATETDEMLAADRSIGATGDTPDSNRQPQRGIVLIRRGPSSPSARRSSPVLCPVCHP